MPEIDSVAISKIKELRKNSAGQLSEKKIRPAKNHHEAYVTVYLAWIGMSDM
jgi:hypothetical protein